MADSPAAAAAAAAEIVVEAVAACSLPVVAVLDCSRFAVTAQAIGQARRFVLSFVGLGNSAVANSSLYALIPLVGYND